MHPRDWDGRRLLQFLAGLALIALSFAVHLGAPADRVTPLAAAAYAAPASVPAPAADTGPPAAEGSVAAADAAGDSAGDPTGDPAGPPAAVGADRLPAGDTTEPRPTARDGAPLTGPAGPGAHGSRAPPRA